MMPNWISSRNSTGLKNKPGAMMGNEAVYEASLVTDDNKEIIRPAISKVGRLIERKVIRAGGHIFWRVIIYV